MGILFSKRPPVNPVDDASTVKERSPGCMFV
jgi:hypothetical protein